LKNQAGQTRNHANLAGIFFVEKNLFFGRIVCCSGIRQGKASGKIVAVDFDGDAYGVTGLALAHADYSSFAAHQGRLRSEREILRQNQNALHFLVQIKPSRGAKKDSLGAHIGGLAKQYLASIRDCYLHWDFEQKPRQLTPIWMTSHCPTPGSRELKMDSILQTGH
jgi:hypothetical protein